jgi:hypothetical protein
VFKCAADGTSELPRYDVGRSSPSPAIRRAPDSTRAPNKDFEEKILNGLAALEPADEDAASVADAVLDVVNAPAGRYPYRIHIDP